MAESEVSKEVPKVVGIEEKCGLDMSSYQDLPKTDCNGSNHHSQANDLDNSYVFVTGADGLPDGAVGDKGVVVGGSSVPPEPQDSQNEELGAVAEEAQHVNAGENGNVEQINGESYHESSHEDGEGVQVSVADSGVVHTCEIESSPEAEIKQIKDSDGTIESLGEAEGFQVSVADSGEVHTGKTGSAAEADVKQVEDSNGKTESMSEAEVKKAVDQNGEVEGVAEGEQEIFDGVKIAESSPCPVENQEFQVRALGLVAEVGENRESNHILLNINSANGEDHRSTTVTEPLEAQQRSLAVVVDVDEHELQSIGVEAEDEAKSTREVAEAAEHEVSTSTSLSLDSESFPTNNKEKTLEEEANTKTDLCSNALENQQGDTEASSIVQHMVGETDESKPVASSTDAHVQTTRDLVLEEKIEDSSVSEVENGTQYPEEFQEQPVVSSTDSQVLTTCDLVLEENIEDSSVSEVENCAPYHEESHEQPVGSSTDSQVQTALDLVLEEKHEESSVSEVENGAQYPEECQEQPVVSSTDSHVLTTRDLALEENIEDSSVSEVENGAQYHEESQEEPVVSSTDSQVQTTRDLVIEEKDEVENGAEYPEESQEPPVVSSIDSHVLSTCHLVIEENNEDSSVSEVENGAQYHEESQEQPLVSGTDSHVPTTCDLVLEEKNEDTSVSEVENGAQYPKESQEQPDGSGASHDTTQSETMAEASVQTQSYPAPNAHSPQSETEVSDVDEIGRDSSSPIVVLESQIIEKVIPGHDSAIRCTPDEASSGSDCALDTVVPEKEIAFEGGEVLSGSKVGDSSPETLDVKLEPDSHVHDFSVMITGEKTDDVTVSCRTEISDSFNANLKVTANIELEVDGVEDVEDQLDGAAENSKENLFVQEDEITENSQNEETSVSTAGLSTASTTDGEDKSIKAKTKPFNFLIRTPRFDDENLREQIRLAKLQVDEKTKLRDAIQLQIQEKRQANSQIHGIDYEYAKGEGRSARKLVRSKRTEIDSLQSVINKAKNALSIEDIDSQIHNMEHMIQHETLPLKEEKQFIREIKQLKQLREQLSSNMGSQDEIKQALEQRQETEDRLKILRKELDLLKNKAFKAEATAAEAGKKYDDEIRRVKELQAQFRAADDVRQTAYAQWQNLRKELSNKSKYFFKYKDDAAIASNYAFSRDTEALYCLCTNQVESFIQLWNTNPEFRRDYIKFNARSNVRRFGTLDCRSLGPDEVPLSIPSYADERGNKMASAPAGVDLAPQILSVELKQKTPGENVISDSKPIKKVTEPKSQKVPNGPPITVQVNGLDTRTGSDLTDEVYEEPIKSKDEIESMRKAEEMRREEAEAKLKEQRRLEALAKANEARERKKRQAEKLQQRAELKTQKEAEQREKEREKRLRKKERKKADATETNNSCETAPSSESAADIDVKDMPPAAKKAQKPWLAPKQSKAKSIPPPLRNRNKKKLQQWMWVGVTSLIILVIFWLGNMGVFSNVALKRRGPVY
ncbi:hypothetical protein C2S51_036270 [Perilla frutescens var. frutescens]|nr:hypothetical protein C2S51_036270 [Perilla frutescens var. frutescens]